ncbi:hypothetical protein [Blastococcus sp. TF02A-26]|uniref:hypothetical protein n=1 Tax=Blastococcus sp. TF02A-26 TaxID=2250577 RepID=UPI000DEA8184|nr:hypothetical protein [Blastococcus sp. TF02A-26]RBY86107.1 hypothetical protein DQ240_09840 [Blastococcus sp. TF02A-26]
MSWPGLVLPVGHRLGPLHGLDGSGPVPGVVRRGDAAELLDPAEAAVWDLARPRPDDPLPGDAALLEQRVARARLEPEHVDRLLARDLLVRVRPEDPAVVPVSARVRARALGSCAGSRADALVFGVPGGAGLTVSAADAEVWLAAVYAADLWSAAAVLRAFQDPDRTTVATAAERAGPLARLWSVVPRFLAAGCGHLDVGEPAAR